ncbi:MAG: GNAT family N-acetyltransferase [Bryobacteraceae bacterium]
MTEIRPLDRSYNSPMLEILRRSPVEIGGLTMCFDRQPDMFAMADLKYDPPAWNGVFEDGKLMGFGLVGYHRGFVNGEVQQVMHLTDCYFHPEARGRGYLTSALPKFFEGGTASLGYAVKMEGNRGSKVHLRRKFVKTRSGITTRYFGELTAQTVLLFLPRRKRSHFPVRRARMDDIDDIVSLLRDEHKPRLFGLAVDRDRFVARLNRRPGLSIDDYYVVEHGGKLAGVCAAWDTSAFKQDRVLEYGFWLKLVRLTTGLASLAGGFPGLPAPGEPFRNVFLTDWAVRDRSIDILRALIEHTYCEYRRRGYFSLVFGSCSEDPLLEATHGYWVDRLRFGIALIALNRKWFGEGALDTRLPFIDVAML